MGMFLFVWTLPLGLFFSRPSPVFSCYFFFFYSFPFPLSPVHTISPSPTRLYFPSAVLTRPIYYILHHLHLYIHILVPNDLILTLAGRILLCLDHVSFLSSISSIIGYRLSLVHQTYLSNIPGLDLAILIYQIASTLPLPSSCLGSPPRNNLKHLPSPILH